MNRKIFNLPSSLKLNRARTGAASYRIVGRPADAGALPMARLSPPVEPFWHPTLLDSLRMPLTRRHE